MGCALTERYEADCIERCGIAGCSTHCQEKSEGKTSLVYDTACHDQFREKFKQKVAPKIRELQSDEKCIRDMEAGNQQLLQLQDSPELMPEVDFQVPSHVKIPHGTDPTAVPVPVQVTVGTLGGQGNGGVRRYTLDVKVDLTSQAAVEGSKDNIVRELATDAAKKMIASQHGVTNECRRDTPTPNKPRWKDLKALTKHLSCSKPLVLQGDIHDWEFDDQCKVGAKVDPPKSVLVTPTCIDKTIQFSLRAWNGPQCGGYSEVRRKIVVTRFGLPSITYFPPDRTVTESHDLDPNNGLGTPKVSDPCGAPITLTYSDSVAAVNDEACSKTITRTWKVDYGHGAACLTRPQTIEVQKDSPWLSTPPERIELPYGASYEPAVTGEPTPVTTLSRISVYTDEYTPYPKLHGYATLKRIERSWKLWKYGECDYPFCNCNYPSWHQTILIRDPITSHPGLRNGGFELGTGHWSSTKDSWAVAPESFTKNARYICGAPHTGNAALLLRDSRWVYQYASGLTPNHRYMLVYWVCGRHKALQVSRGGGISFTRCRTL